MSKPRKPADARGVRRRVLVADDDPERAKRVIAEVESQGYVGVWVRTHEELMRAAEELDPAAACIADDFSGGLAAKAAGPGRPSGPLRFLPLPPGVEGARERGRERVRRGDPVEPPLPARVLILEDRPKKLDRIRESLSRHSHLVPAPVSTMEALPAALARGAEVALVRLGFRGGEGMLAVDTILRHDRTIEPAIYTDRRPSAPAVQIAKGRLLDERKLIRDRGQLVSVMAGYCVDRRRAAAEAERVARAQTGEETPLHNAVRVEQALAGTKSVRDAARLLGIPEEEVRELMRRYGITAPS